ncbi:MAG: recombinase RecT [Dokdonella sp.]|uniref:recombinase RecT n=1 Tax=Dokdonella sp. TaxID=2291710 RepID=UPI003F80C86D
MSSAALREAATGEKADRTPKIYRLLNDPRIAASLVAVAGKYMTKERLLRLCINAVKKTPKLLECDPETVLGAMMTACALGLEPNTVQQQAFLIPYERRVKDGNGRWTTVVDCQFQVGARGYVTLAYRSEHISSLDAAAIHDGDVFEHLRGSNAFLKYATALRDRGPLLGAFSYVKLRDGGESSIVLPLDELMKIRGRSETYRALVRKVETAQDDEARARAERNLAETPWVMWEDDMATKSAIKKHAKALPIAAGDTFAVAASLDDQAEVGALDLQAMANPDRARAALQDVDDVPVIENRPSESLEVSGEAFAATARQAEPVQQQVSQGPAPVSRAPAPRATAKRTNATASPAPAPQAEQEQRPTASPHVLAEWVDQVKTAPDRDAAAEIVDLARSQLAAPDAASVAEAFTQHWPS